MTYLQDKKLKQDKLIKRLSIFAVAVLFLVGINKVQYFVFPSISKLLGIAPAGADLFGENFISRNLKTRARLAIENESLKNKISEMEYSRVQSALIESENQSLRAILQADQNSSNKILVKSLQDSSVYGTIIINSGLNKNIKVGDFLLGAHSGLIGTVSSVSEKNATVDIISSVDSGIEMLTPASGIRILAKPESRGVLFANVPRETELEVGESVVLAGNQNILVGIVAETVGDEKTPFKKVLIRLTDEYRYSPYLYIQPK